MENKVALLGITGVIGSFIANLLGGWSTDMVTLLICMIIDFATGLIVAGVFKKSTKSQNGALESRAGFKGLARKVIVLLFVIIGHRLDLLLGYDDLIRTAIIIAFIVNELISITENAALIGIPIPKKLQDAIDILNDKGGEDDER